MAKRSNKPMTEKVEQLNPISAKLFGKGEYNYRYKGGPKGLKNEIIALDWVDIRLMPGAQLYERVRQAQRITNAAYNRIEKTIGFSPAMQMLEEAGGKITMKGMRKKNPDGSYTYDINRMRHELRTAQQFLRSETSTVKGARKWLANTQINPEIYKRMGKAERKRFWEAVRHLKDNYESLYKIYGSGNTIKLVEEIEENDAPGGFLTAMEMEEIVNKAKPVMEAAKDGKEDDPEKYQRENKFRGLT